MRKNCRLLFWIASWLLLLISSIPNLTVAKRIGWKTGFRFDYVIHYVSFVIVGILCFKSYGIGYKSVAR